MRGGRGAKTDGAKNILMFYKIELRVEVPPPLCPAENVIRQNVEGRARFSWLERDAI
jgi:hypothetical protein